MAQEVTGMAELELVLDDGRPARASHFFRAGADLLNLLDELSETPVEWVLSDLRLSSSVARVSAPPDQQEAAGCLRRAAHGLAVVQAGDPLPEGWNPDAVLAARHLASVDVSGGPARLTLVDDGQATQVIDLNPALGTRLADLQPTERTMPGAVRGRVVGVSVARGNRASLKLRSGPVVRVSFPDDLRVPLRDALYDDVELVGQVRQESAGRVFHIRADSVRRLIKPTVRWSDLFGIDPDITGGRSVADYLESVRGEA